MAVVDQSRRVAPVLVSFEPRRLPLELDGGGDVARIGDEPRRGSPVNQPLQAAKRTQESTKGQLFPR